MPPKAASHRREASQVSILLDSDCSSRTETHVLFGILRHVGLCVFLTLEEASLQQSSTRKRARNLCFPSYKPKNAHCSGGAPLWVQMKLALPKTCLLTFLSFTIVSVPVCLPQRLSFGIQVLGVFFHVTFPSQRLQLRFDRVKIGHSVARRGSTRRRRRTRPRRGSCLPSGRP